MSDLTSVVSVIAAVALFAIGLRLSAFFSGSETGFYRISLLRLNIDAQSGDEVARQILWFANNPGYFVATTLVGNNVANYITTLSIGVGTASLVQSQSELVEIVGTLLCSPIVFLFGELIPKNLYYRAPMHLLKRGAGWFQFYYRLFYVVSYPLIGVTKLFEKFGDTAHPTMELVLGRKRLVQVLHQGHQHGLLTDVQSRLVHSLLQSASEPVIESMTPADRVLGLTDTSSREEVLEYAARFGIANVVVRKTDSEDSWYGYLRVADVAVNRRPLSMLIRNMPIVSAQDNKLEALTAMRNAGSAFAAIHDNGRFLGIISERGLRGQLMRPSNPALAATLAKM